MSGCHVPPSNPNKTYVLQEMVSKGLEERVKKLENFIFYLAESQVPEVICDKCQGKGTLVDDGIL